MKPCCEATMPKSYLGANTILGVIAITLLGITLLGIGAFGKSNQKQKNIRYESNQAIADSTPPAKSPKSPRMTANGTIGNNTVMIDYSSPRVRGN
jgi:hypothetical protein